MTFEFGGENEGISAETIQNRKFVNVVRIEEIEYCED